MGAPGDSAAHPDPPLAERLRALPSVDRLVARLERDDGGLHRSLLVAFAREVLDDARDHLRNGVIPGVSEDDLVAGVKTLAARRLQPTLVRAVNASGVILHTNLGRAPLSTAAQRAVADAAAAYSTLELDLATGRRGSRHHHVEALLTRLCGSEAAFAVNNNAAAVLVSLAALARDRDVIVSRGELVEIGGSFRLPEIMAASGARLVEVGTTNRTYARDYDAAVTQDTALLLKVHRSNFEVAGFVHDVPLQELVGIGRRHQLPVMMDLGSGCLVDLRSRGLPHEPTVPDAIQTGCDVVTFSGDKLLGGPQAGIIAGTSGVVGRIRGHPMARAVRMDKLDYAALAATLQQYLDPDRVWTEVPVLAMLARPADRVREDAGRLAARLTQEPAQHTTSWHFDVIQTEAEPGGGSLPGVKLPSFAVAVTGSMSPDELDRRLRSHEPPIIGRIADDRYLLDVRTLLPSDADVIVVAFQSLTDQAPSPKP
ncbi:MAG: L-seryl-tRNA(Sec) selenium transferase [bacterium]